MIRVSLYLKIRKNQNQHTVYIRLKNKHEDVLIPLDIKVEKRHWDGDKQSFYPINSSFGPLYLEQNIAIQTQILKISNILYSNQNTAPSLIKSMLNDEILGQNLPLNQTHEPVIQRDSCQYVLTEFINLHKGIYQEGTLKGYKDLRTKIKQFNSHIALCDINLDFYDRFKKHLMLTNLSNNSVGKVFKNLKAFLKWAEDRSYGVNPIYKRFEVYRKPTQIIYLTQNELDVLYDLDLSKTQHLERAKDLFIVQCRTGLRVSDLKLLGKHHCYDGFIHMQAHKNMNPILIKITPWVKEILEKYSFQLPDLSEQKYNKHIKTICQLAGINTLVEKVNDRTKKRTVIPKYKLISSHIAVKTFITHCCELGITAKVVATITGKSVEVILKHYYGTNDQTIAREMENAFRSN